MRCARGMWARDVQRSDDGELEIAGIPVSALAEEFGTPLFVVSEADFRARARDFKDSFDAAFADLCGGVDVYYAGKAFLCTEVARWVAQEGLRLDTCSGGELAVAAACRHPRRQPGPARQQQVRRRTEPRAGHGPGPDCGGQPAGTARGWAPLPQDRGDTGQRHAAPDPRRARPHARVHRHRARRPEVRPVHGSRTRSTGGLSAGCRSRGRSTGERGHPAAGPALPHRLADLRPRGLRAGGPRPARLPGRGQGAARRRASRTGPGRRLRHRLHRSGHPAPGRRDRCRRWPPSSRATCAELGLAVPRISIEPGRAIVGPTTFTLYRAGHPQDGARGHRRRRHRADAATCRWTAG